MNPQTACAALDRASFFPFTFFVVDGLHKALTARDTRVHEGKGSAACFVSRDVVPFLMGRVAWIVVVAILGTSPLLAQGKRLWLLRAPGEMVEYDPLTFAVKKTIKVPAEAVKSPANLSVNRVGQVLFFTPVSLPLSEEEAAPQKVWIWNGSASATIDLGVDRKVEETGSNQAVVELAPIVYLSADGKHLVWFANQARRLQREEVDLSTTITWEAWQTDLSGAGREELVSTELPDCRCKTGSCEESCPVGAVWVPDTGVEGAFLMTQYVAGQTAPIYKNSSLYQEQSGKWTATPLPEPMQRVLDATSDGSMIVEAIPDTGCCGWSNQSNDQTLVIAGGKARPFFDEQASYKNVDYDVSFYTPSAQVSPELKSVAMTVVATAQANKPIQLSQQGQASPEESARIRKALADLPVVAVKNMEDPPKQIATVPHASLIGWISEKELLIVEDHTLVAYNVATGARRRSRVRVEDAGHVFLR